MAFSPVACSSKSQAMIKSKQKGLMRSEVVKKIKDLAMAVGTNAQYGNAQAKFPSFPIFKALGNLISPASKVPNSFECQVAGMPRSVWDEGRRWQKRKR